MEPALDVLWYTLDNFAPLVWCMTGDLYKEEYSIEYGLEEVVTLVSNGFYPFHQFSLSNGVFSKVDGSERLGTFYSRSNACPHSQS